MIRSLPIVAIALLLLSPVHAQQAAAERIQSLAEQVMHGSEVTIEGVSLAAHGIFVPSACGGGGSCGQCGVKVLSGGGDILPTELAHITKRESREGNRLACMVAIKQAPALVSRNGWVTSLHDGDLDLADLGQRTSADFPFSQPASGVVSGEICRPG